MGFESLNSRPGNAKNCGRPQELGEASGPNRLQACPQETTPASTLTLDSRPPGLWDNLFAMSAPLPHLYLAVAALGTHPWLGWGSATEPTEPG